MQGQAAERFTIILSQRIAHPQRHFEQVAIFLGHTTAQHIASDTTFPPLKTTPSFPLFSETLAVVSQYLLCVAERIALPWFNPSQSSQEIKGVWKHIENNPKNNNDIKKRYLKDVENLVQSNKRGWFRL